jgi:hypothetical protein
MEGRGYRPGTPAPIFANPFEGFAEESLDVQLASSQVRDIGVGGQPVQPWEFSLDIVQHDNQSPFDYNTGPDKLDYGSRIQHPPSAEDGHVNTNPYMAETDLLQDWPFDGRDSVPMNRDFLQWIDGAHRPPVSCSYCRYHRLECLVIRTTLANPNPVSACSSCVALFRECSLAIGKKRVASEFETNEPIIGHLHGVNEEYQNGLEPSSWQDTTRVPATGMVLASPLDGAEPSFSNKAGFKSKRTLSRQDIKVLKAWLSEHRHTPYPSEDQKLELRATTGLTLLQISNWFANARRRQRQIGGISIIPRDRGSKQKLSKQEAADCSPLSRWQNSPPEDDPVAPSVVAQAITSTSKHYQERADTSGPDIKREHTRYVSIDARPVSNCDTSQSGISSDSSNSAWSHSSWASNRSYTSLNRPKRRRYQKRKKVGTSGNTFSAMYHCTFCPDSFDKKHDWQRHEMSIHLPLEQWICCSSGTGISQGNPSRKCIFCGVLNPTETHLDSHAFSACAERPAFERTFKRKDHLRQHLLKFHGCIKPLDSSIALWKVEWGWLRSRCGFCDAWFSAWEERMTHLATHFKDGAMIQEWAGDWGFNDDVLALLQYAELPGTKEPHHDVIDGISIQKEVPGK